MTSPVPCYCQVSRPAVAPAVSAWSGPTQRRPHPSCPAPAGLPQNPGLGEEGVGTAGTLCVQRKGYSRNPAWAEVGMSQLAPSQLLLAASQESPSAPDPFREPLAVAETPHRCLSCSPFRLHEDCTPVPSPAGLWPPPAWLRPPLAQALIQPPSLPCAAWTPGLQLPWVP